MDIQSQAKKFTGQYLCTLSQPAHRVDEEMMLFWDGEIQSPIYILVTDDVVMDCDSVGADVSSSQIDLLYPTCASGAYLVCSGSVFTVAAAVADCLCLKLAFVFHFPTLLHTLEYRQTRSVLSCRREYRQSTRDYALLRLLLWAGRQQHRDGPILLLRKVTGQSRRWVN